MKLLVFSSTRQIREYYKQNKYANILLDNAINISEFLERICYVNARKSSSYETLLLMKEACEKSKNLEIELKIPSDFFAFLRNHEYLFSFFKELSLEKKSVEDLKNNDYYATYNEHLEILDQVYQNYLSLLEQKGLYDALSLPKIYTINRDFLDEFEGIVYYLQGFLSKFEEDLLCEIAKFKEVILSFRTSKFNLEYFEKLEFFKDFRLEINTDYEIDISHKKILKAQSLSARNSKIKLKKFDLRSLQCAFVMDEISHFVRKGLKPENIVVITPDESFCELLRLFDKDKMLNFANGISVKETFFYQKLHALYESADSAFFAYDFRENYFEDKNTNFDYYNTLLHGLKLEFIEFQSKFNEKCEWEYFENLLMRFLQDENKELKILIQKELFFIKDLLNHQNLTLKEILWLFFMQISQLTLSDVGGGKVTVMGLLESRGLYFDGVIIIDFNEEFIPKRSVNELFLNNEIRKKAGLISYDRRENLQRFYYENLMKNASEVSICFVENDEKTPSRLLSELDFEFFYENHIDQKAYLQALNFDRKSVNLNLNPLPAPILKHNPFDFEISFTRLNLLLSQKRTYYYRYILNLAQPREFNEESKAKDQGNFIHKMLEMYYQKNPTHFDLNEFINLLEKEQENYKLSKLDLEIYKLRFVRFAQNEKEHFSQGYRVAFTEKECSNVLTINNQQIRLKGIIDRIDVCEDKNFIIDYKSGKVPTNSYQLAFYQALYDRFAKVSFYDLKRMKRVSEKVKSYEELEQILKDLIVQSKEAMEFENDKDEYCPYKLIYKKELK